MKIIAVTQARVGSSRLPGKVLKKINSKTLLQIHLERVLKSRKINGLVVATTHEDGSEKIAKIASESGCNVYRGSLDNVLDRFFQAVQAEKPDYVVRVTSDCPLIDAGIIDLVITTCIEKGLDYCSNTLQPTYPDGMDVEVFTFAALEKAHSEAILTSDKEHVTAYIWRNSTFKGGTLFKSENVANDEDFSSIRLTVDELSDLGVIDELVKQTGDDKAWKVYVEYLQKHPELLATNSHFKRNEGYKKSLMENKTQLSKITNFAKSNQYRLKIHDLIPGGAHTYSKGDDQFPQLSPAAISHGKGAYVWDVDGNKYLDCSMGLTSVSLGHAYEPVLKRVREELEKGVNFQRPSYIEMEMAEKFLSLVPSHDMIKFAKNGSLVTTAAVKLARAFTGRKLIAFPGDHPFYSYDDWFIGKTACSIGVPEEFSNLSVTFKSGDIQSLKELFDKYPGQIAGVITEPERSSDTFDAPSYLRQLIDLTHKNGALFIADEMITGFKSGLPGSFTNFGLDPDMATWGKGIANGFSFCALTGKKEVMELGGIREKGKEKVFLVSTTHGGETHAIAAGLATIDEFQQKKVIAHNHDIGDYFCGQIGKVIAENDLSESVELIKSRWMPLFVCKDNSGAPDAGLRTLLLQEMIASGVLFQGAWIPCFSHTKSDVDFFAEALDDSLKTYKKGLKEGYQKYLAGEPAKPVFRKYL